ncbi:adenosine kinase [Candidatus Woesearchaeota archaeon]|nr:adenosine kinase [Candidatus Woesearchaeota archaeon]MBU3942137.1 adenosine kinase [Nanoarchaeota archaeon]
MKYDVVGIGYPLLDKVVEVNEDFILKNGLMRNNMNLVNIDKSKKILSMLTNSSVNDSAGGSVPNTLASVCSLGGKSLFIGMIGNDNNGNKYRRLIEKLGVTINLKSCDEIQGTSVIMVTPDAERTMATCLGAGMNLTKNDINLKDISNSKILHIEAYQLDGEKQAEAVFYAMEHAKKNNILISIDLADPALIERHRENVNKIMKDYADIVFVNEDEAEKLTNKKPAEAAEEIKKFCKIAIVKIGKKGSLVMDNNGLHKIKGFKVNAINTTGAGDAYSGGFLYGISHGFDVKTSGKIASYVAAQVVASHDSMIKRNIQQEIAGIIKG